MLETSSSLNLVLILILFGFTGASVFSTLFLLYRYISWLRGQDDWVKELQAWQNQEDGKDLP